MLQENAMEHGLFNARPRFRRAAGSIDRDRTDSTLVVPAGFGNDFYRIESTGQ